MILKGRVWVIYVKELVDILRDRRTLIAMIVVPVLLYPLLMLGSVQAVSMQESSLREEIVVVIATSNAGQKAFLDMLIASDREALKREADATSNGEPDDEERPQPLNADVRIANPDMDMLAMVRAREIHVGVELLNYDTIHPDVGQLRVRRHFDSEEVRSSLAARWLVEMLNRCSQRERERRCLLFNIPVRAVEPIVIESVVTSTGGSILSQILPLILVLMTITGAIYPAIDLTAGERERGTLETLMVCPVPVIQLVVGKFMVVTTIAIMGAVLNLASISATVFFGGFESMLAGSQDVSLPFAVFPIILLALVPFAIFFSAVMIAVCSYAHTFKEAQNYITPIILVALVPAGLAVLPTSKLAGPMLVMPVANMVLLTKELLLGASESQIVGGNVTWTALAWVLASTTLYAAAAVAVATKIFGTESVIFSDTGSIRSAFSRRLFRPSPRPSVSMAALVAALLFPAWFYLQSGLGTAAPDDMIALLRGTAIWMPVFFVVLPLLVLLYWRVGVVTTWRLGTGRLKFYIAALLLGLTAWIPLSELLLLQEKLVAFPEFLHEQDAKLLEALKTISPGLAVLLLAVIPGICEELFFRGFFLSGLRGSVGKWTAIVLSACVFAVFHISFFRIPTTVVLGIVLGVLCWQARSIWPAVLCHVVHNGFAVLRPGMPRLDEFLGVHPDKPLAHLPIGVILLGIAAVLLGLMLCRRPSADAEKPQAVNL